MMSGPEAIFANNNTVAGETQEFVTFWISGQLFGLPIRKVREVFAANQLTPVPRAPRAIRGLLNLRGRVVTAICLGTLLGLEIASERSDDMAIGIESNGESYALLVERIGDVMQLSDATLEPNPIHLKPEWQPLSVGVHRLPDTILMLLDLDRTIDNDRLAA